VLGYNANIYLYLDQMHLNSRRGEVGVEIPLTDLSPPHVCACPKAGNEFPTLYTVVFLCPMSSVEMI
jgi:hypothetical protein